MTKPRLYLPYGDKILRQAHKSLISLFQVYIPIDSFRAQLQGQTWTAGATVARWIPVSIGNTQRLSVQIRCGSIPHVDLIFLAFFFYFAYGFLLFYSTEPGIRLSPFLPLCLTLAYFCVLGSTLLLAVCVSSTRLDFYPTLVEKYILLIGIAISA